MSEKKRPTTQGDGGVVGDRDRYTAKTPPKGVAAQLAAPDPIEDDCTGKYEGEQLAAMRAKRPTPMRLGHVEERVDRVVASIGEFKADVAEKFADVKTYVAGELGDVKAAFGQLAGEVNGLAKVVDEASKRDHVKFTVTADLEKAKQTSAMTVDTAKQVDAIDATKAKRELRYKLFGAALGGGGVITIIIKLLEHWRVL